MPSGLQARATPAFWRTCPPGRYDVELEPPPEPGQNLIYREAGKHWDVDFETLAEVVRRHLSLTPGTP